MKLTLSFRSLRERLPSKEAVLGHVQKHLLLAALVSAGVFLLIFFLFPSWRAPMIPIGTALAALFGAIPGLISERARGRWFYALVGTAFVGVVTWYTTTKLEDQLDTERKKLETTRNELATVQSRYYLFEEDVRNHARRAGHELTIEFANILDKEWKTKILAKPPSQRDYIHIDDTIRFMLTVDPKNGHALYFNGQAKRARKMPGSGQHDFFQYLEVEEGLSEEERGGSTAREVCYQRPRGYCKQRTAWIQHLLANDFILEANKAKNCEFFRISLNYVVKALTNFPSGFSGEGQGIPTKTILKDAESALKNC